MTTPHTPPTQAELDAWKRHACLTVVECDRLITEVERLRGNPLIGTCVLCGLSIWSNQERMMDGRGIFHPGCVTRGEIARLTKEVEELRKDKERLAQKPIRASVDERLVLDEPVKNRAGEMCGLCDGFHEHEHPTLKCTFCGRSGLAENMIGHECDDAMQQKERDEADFNEDAGKV